MKHRFLFLMLFIHVSLFAEGEKFINPLTDICWECVFPMTVASVKISKGHKDFQSHSETFCYCHGVPPKPGIPLTFWEPTKMIDVTKEAYKLVGLGGISIDKATIKNRGNLGRAGAGAHTSFAHVHIYDYPVFALLGILTDFACIEDSEFDISFFSELDPSWYDDSLANILNAETALFANPLAQVACIADCTSSSISKPLDDLFWCAGCHGSLYPFSGTVGAHVGDIQASLLLMQRGIAKMHRSGFIKGYKEGNYCERSYMPIWKKTQYKTQIVYPSPQTEGECPSLGGTEVIWGSGKSYPYKGEEFVYLLWTKKQCCLDASRTAVISEVKLW